MKVPYVKIFDAQGVCLNPITKDNPYIHKADLFRKKKKQPKNNKKGIRLLIVNVGYGMISKFHVKIQVTTSKSGVTKCLTHYVEKTIIKSKVTNKQV